MLQQIGLAKIHNSDIKLNSKEEGNKNEFVTERKVFDD
jgi:hypothetical protein